MCLVKNNNGERNDDLRVTTRTTTKEQKIKKRMDSSNIKRKWFDEPELENYGIPRNDIDIILEYQKRLPILQQENSNWIDGRCLHKQLGVAKDYSNWFKQQILDIGLENEIDYKVCSSSKASKTGSGGYNKIDYLVKISVAKEIAMIAGSKGGRTSKYLQETSRIARKYFIAIESAYNLREKWNYDRADSIVGYTGLQQAFIKFRPQLLETLPDWTKWNVQKADFWAINDCIIGMSTKAYRNIMGLSQKESVRNAFTEQQLEYVSELERFDADLITIHNVFDFKKRHSLLLDKYEEITKCGRVSDNCNT